MIINLTVAPDRRGNPIVRVVLLRTDENRFEKKIERISRTRSEPESVERFKKKRKNVRTSARAIIPKIREDVYITPPHSGARILSTTKRLLFLGVRVRCPCE